MKTAREVAHDALAGVGLRCGYAPAGTDHGGGWKTVIDIPHASHCDRLTAAIEAWDAEYQAELRARWNAINQANAAASNRERERDEARPRLAAAEAALRRIAATEGEASERGCHGCGRGVDDCDADGALEDTRNECHGRIARRALTSPAPSGLDPVTVLREHIARAVGISQRLAEANDSDDELALIHELSAWADAARSLASPREPEGV